MENRKERTKARLRDAMTQLLHEKPFDQITTTELVKVAKIYFTGRLAKRPFMLAKGIKIDVWIDDYPEAVVKDADEIWPTIAPEGDPVVPIYD